VSKGKFVLKIKVGESTADVNGKQVQLPYAAKLENEKTMFPTSILNSFLNQ
jgi:hypothetical protein